MSWSLDTEEEIEKFGVWLVKQFFRTGKEPPDNAIFMSIIYYFEEGGREEDD